MILTDTGPLVALIIKSDPYRERVEQAIARIRDSMVTTEACFTEAMYLLGRAEGWKAQEALGQMLQSTFLALHPATQDDSLQAVSYMERFRDQPCDYADATLLVAAESLGSKRILTLDSHFHAYRISGNVALEVLP